MFFFWQCATCQGQLYFPKPPNPPNLPPNPPNPLPPPKLKFWFWLFCWQKPPMQVCDGRKLLNWGEGAEWARLRTKRTRRAATFMLGMLSLMEKLGDLSGVLSGDDSPC